LQGADILIYRATFVPVGEDQVPHINSWEIARRFNHIYGESRAEKRSRPRSRSWVVDAWLHRDLRTRYQEQEIRKHCNRARLLDEAQNLSMGDTDGCSATWKAGQDDPV
jgi:tryptophanyl-tRNA synthetase